MIINKDIYNIREKIYKTFKFLPNCVKKAGINFFANKQMAKFKRLKTPLMLILYITNRCNARCKHCFYWQSINNAQDQELTLEQLSQIAASLREPLNTLLITGGEPFLRKEIVEICRAFVCKNKTKKINIASNGYLTEKIVDGVKLILEQNNSLDLNVQISLDGLKEVHNALRGIDIFDRAVDTIEKLEKIQNEYKNFHVTILTTVSKINFKEIERLKCFTRERFLMVHHGFQFVRSAKFDTYNINCDILENFDPQEIKDILLSIDEMKETIEKGFFADDKGNSLLNNYVRIMNEGVVEMKQNKTKFIECLAGLYDGVIYSNGDVAMCEFTKPFGNLRQFNFDFYTLWTGSKAKLRRNDIKNCFCAHNCNIMNAMKCDKKVLMKLLSRNVNK
jgi:MoaA/NifB/PqqE/SkfB family radical SAM enzyme